MRLSKHHGLGNDFLVLLDPHGKLTVTPELAVTVCDRRRGVGADGFLQVTSGGHADGVATDVTMVLHNPDGSRAAMSGNGIACVAQAAALSGMASGSTVRVATDAGLRTVAVALADAARTHWATVDMGAPVVGDDAPDWVGGAIRNAIHVDMGNPHLVLEVDADAPYDLAGLGERANATVAGGTNLEVVSVGPGRDEITMAVYERGVGPTPACGTGACAAAAAALVWDRVGKQVTVHQPGGSAAVDLDATISLTVPVVHVANVDFPLR